MPDYRRSYQPGGTYFFTVVTEGRAPILCGDLARSILHTAIAECASQRPFSLDAIILLPDHLHAQWTLPPDDWDYSTRWASIKSRFTHEWLAFGDLLRTPVRWTAIQKDLVLQLGYVLVFGSAAWARFASKDVLA